MRAPAPRLARAPLCAPCPSACARARPSPPSALHIDRAAHLEAAWRRQQAADAAARVPCPPGTVCSVADAAALDTLATAAGSAVVAVFFHSRSCGTCKELLEAFKDTAADAAAASARCVFVSHDVRDAFDEPTDLARLHGVRSVPTVLFLGGGAAVRRVALADSRVVAPVRSARARGGARGWLRATLTQVLLSQAPSARR